MCGDSFPGQTCQQRSRGDVDRPLSFAPLTVISLGRRNHFKAVNDTLGHAVGDTVLSAIGARLTAWAGPRATVGRDRPALRLARSPNGPPPGRLRRCDGRAQQPRSISDR
ncbi:diguanylate cyclase domain-containing protein [Streptomyces sp. CLV115]|uniref:diguanylate cyclase domain-containing protein n=1 Tax=Streptomyces sp. CLV115 TaxID=3138502 RepID=UPI00406C3FA4